MTNGERKGKRESQKLPFHQEERNEYREYIDTTVDSIQFRASHENVLSLTPCNFQHKDIFKATTEWQLIQKTALGSHR